MIPVYIRLIISFSISAAAVILYCVRRTKLRLSVMIAMLLSSCGDVFMVNSAKWGNFSVYTGAAFFIAAHLTYANGFFRRVKMHGCKSFNCGTFIASVIMVLSAAVIGIFAFTVPDDKKPVMFVLILFYIAAIGMNTAACFTAGFAFRGKNILLPVAALVFYASDIFIFAEMLSITSALRPYVWFLYPEAQLLLVLFCDSRRRAPGC